MKNVMVVNYQSESKHRLEEFQTELKAQIENSLQVGWKPEDMIIIANFDFEFMGVKTQKFDLANYCLTGSKMFATSLVFKNNLTTDPIWAHDLDCWQTTYFDMPEFKDVGISTYSSDKFNGGSLFWKPSAMDIIDEVLTNIGNEKAKKEEPILNQILKSDKYKDRVTVLNCTYNVGCSGYVERYQRSEKPVKAIHMHPTNRIAFCTHCRDRNHLGETSMNKRLFQLFMKYFGEKIKAFTYPADDRGHPGDYHPPAYLHLED